MSRDREPADDAPARVHVIFKTHLDLGFTALAKEVAAAYVGRFIPRAIETARALREKHGARRFVWTTGSWLVHHALEVSTPRRRRELERAIAEGDIVWHALPFTTHTELLDPPLLRVGLGIARELDTRFGRRTRAAKMTDVPGHTRSLVPLLAEAGVEFLHLGVNPASLAPAVPDAFRWRHDDDSSVAVVYDKRSYGGLSRVPGCADALYFAHTGDNHGPCPAEEVEAVFARLRERFPAAQILASTLDEFALALRPALAGLPEVTQELGDTWIHGVGSDPAKVAGYRALARWHAARPAPRAARERRALQLFARRLLLVAEHTWGLDVKLGLEHEREYDRRFRREEFLRARREPAYRALERSWREQRAYLDSALAALRGTLLHAEARLALGATRPRRLSIPAVRGAEARRLLRGETFSTPHFDFALDPATGALRRLRARATGREWADARHPLGLLAYEVFSADDYAVLWRRYSQGHAANRHWSVPDFLKPGVETAVRRHELWRPRLRRAVLVEREAGPELRASLEFPAAPRHRFGCPAEFQLSVLFRADAPVLEFTVQWFGKPATRVPEATWMSFTPRVAPDARWSLRKLGAWIDPRAVAEGGNRTLHAVELCRLDEGNATGQLLVDPVSSPLVAPGRPSLVRFSQRQPRPGDGLHFNLHNNTWGTNFPLWYEDDASFRFVSAWGPSPQV